MSKHIPTALLSKTDLFADLIRPLFNHVPNIGGELLAHLAVPQPGRRLMSLYHPVSVRFVFAHLMFLSE